MKMKKLYIAVLMMAVFFVLSACETTSEVVDSDEIVMEKIDEAVEEAVEYSEKEESILNSPEGYTITALSVIKYSSTSLNVRDLPDADGNKIGGLEVNQEVNVIGECEETGWYQIEYKGGVGYVSNKYLNDTKVDVINELEKEESVEIKDFNEEILVEESQVISEPVTEPVLESTPEPEQSPNPENNTNQENSSSNETSSGVTVPSQDQAVANGVWVPTQGGTKYHSNSGCSNMENPIQVSLDTAIANGYTACKRCH